MPKKLSQEEFEAKVKANNPNIDILSKYDGQYSRVIRRCNVCGDVREVQAKSLLSDGGCRYCAILELGKKKRKTHDEFMKEMSAKLPNIEVLSEYKTRIDKMTFKCKIDGTIWEASPNAILAEEIGCPVCWKKARGHKDYEGFMQDINKKFPKIQSLSKFKNASDKGKFKCLECDYEWEAVPSYLINRAKYGCPRCCGKARVSEEEMIARVKETNPRVEYISGYTFMGERATFKCKLCGNVWDTRIYSILTGCGCPKCNMSHAEIRIEKYLKSANVNFEEQKVFEDCKNIKVLPFDFYLPDYRILVEAQGMQHYEPVEYFGGEKRFKRIQKNDNIKKEYCKNNNIKLIEIPYTDFNRIEEILDNYLFPKQDGNAFSESGAKWEILRCAARSIHMKITTIMQSAYTFS